MKHKREIFIYITGKLINTLNCKALEVFTYCFFYYRIQKNIYDFVNNQVTLLRVHSRNQFTNTCFDSQDTFRSGRQDQDCLPLRPHAANPFDSSTLIERKRYIVNRNICVNSYATWK